MWHIFWLWVYYNAQTVQAACAVLGVLGLAIYAFDTRKMRLAAEKQVEATIRPVIVIGHSGGTGYYFINYGPGPALNVRWEYEHVSRGTQVMFRAAIETGVKYDFGDPSGIAYPGKLFRVDYESTSGRTYVTSATNQKVEGSDRNELKLEIKA